MRQIAGEDGHGSHGRGENLRQLKKLVFNAGNRLLARKDYVIVGQQELRRLDAEKRGLEHGLAEACERVAVLQAKAAEQEAELSRLHERFPPARAFYLTNDGECPICGCAAAFVATHPWLRDHYVCSTCLSVPRERALMQVLKELCPNWRELTVHESSPSKAAASNQLRRECSAYTASQYFADLEAGQERDGCRSENLEAQTFAEASFDLVITQDVMEHVLDYEKAFAEIGRTLKPGGAHVFTTPIYDCKKSERTAVRQGNTVRFLREPPEYHGNPIDNTGALVTVRYGDDICELVEAACGLKTERLKFCDFSRGLVADFLDVCVTRKPA